jgi:hypothetical protein
LELGGGRVRELIGDALVAPRLLEQLGLDRAQGRDQGCVGTDLLELGARRRKRGPIGQARRRCCRRPRADRAIVRERRCQRQRVELDRQRPGGPGRGRQRVELGLAQRRPRHVHDLIALGGVLAVAEREQPVVSGIVEGLVGRDPAVVVGRHDLGAVEVALGVAEDRQRLRRPQHHLLVAVVGDVHRRGRQLALLEPGQAGRRRLEGRRRGHQAGAPQRRRPRCLEPDPRRSVAGALDHVQHRQELTQRLGVGLVLIGGTVDAIEEGLHLFPDGLPQVALGAHRRAIALMAFAPAAAPARAPASACPGAGPA